MEQAIRVLHVDDEPGFADMVAPFIERADERITVQTVMRVDVDTLSRATVSTEDGRRYRTLTANRSGETTSNDEE